MKQIVIIVIFISMFASVNGQKNRYLIFDGKNWGFIDKNGKTIIKPQFISADNFSEDLAAVRIGGRYGYIDTLGNIAIPPQYDLATSFINGQAKVFIEGRPFFLYKHGTITFSHPFRNITSFDNHTFAIATTNSGKYCLIDKKGNRITDTVFKMISYFGNGVLGV